MYPTKLLLHNICAQLPVKYLLPAAQTRKISSDLNEALLLVDFATLARPKKQS